MVDKSLNSYIVKIDNNHADFSPAIFAIYKYLKENKSKKLQKIIEKYSGVYFSPSLLRSFLENPAGCLFSELVEDSVSVYAEAGTITHQALEEYYRIPPFARQAHHLENIKNYKLNMIEDKHLYNLVNNYISNYFNVNDYLNGKLSIEDQLECDCELRIKDDLIINGENVGRCSCIIDRVDYRNGKVFIVDYKTGMMNSKKLTFDGYLSQLLIYKLLAEQELNESVSGTYICGLKDKKYFELDCSKENENKLHKMINKFNNHIDKCHNSMIYNYTNKGFFNTPKMSAFRSIMTDTSLQNVEIPIEISTGTF